MIKSLRLTKDELFKLLQDFECPNNKKVRCTKFDYVELSENIFYFTDYFEFINSVENIDLIKVFLEFDRKAIIKNIEVNIFCNIDMTRTDDWAEYSGQSYRFNKKPNT